MTLRKTIGVLFLSLAMQARGVQFKVTAPGDTPAGRLIVFLIRDGSGIDAKAEPVHGPFWSNPQPMYGIDIARPATDSTFTIDDSATSFPDPPSKLPPGKYRAQAALIARHESGNWRLE